MRVPDVARRTMIGKTCARHEKTTGRPCTRSAVWADTCRLHWTGEEAQAYRAEQERRERERDEVLPACWLWSATPSEVAAAGQANTYDQAVQLLRAWQQSRCAMCGAVCPLVLDHDHGTGFVRGWLCTSCNLREPSGGGAFLRYRERNPATTLGVRLRYCHLVRGEDFGIGPLPSIDAVQRWQAEQEMTNRRG